MTLSPCRAHAPGARRALSGRKSPAAVLLTLLLGTAAAMLTGCGATQSTFVGEPGVPGTPAPDTLTGNWQIAATTTAGSTAFSALAGSILQESATSASSEPLDMILQAVNPSLCFTGLASTLPFQGSRAGENVTVRSLAVTDQFIDVTAVSSNDGDTMTGTYSIGGGCANGVAGALSGTKISPLTGSYSGAFTPAGAAGTLALNLTQDDSADGYGYFHVSGTATIAGVPCFTTGTLNANVSTVLGQQVTLTLTTNEATPSTATLTGTLDPTAGTLTLSSVNINAGGCAGDDGAATLTRATATTAAKASVQP